MVKSEPRMLLYSGQFVHEAMRAERVTEDEVRAAIRAQGTSNLKSVGAVVLETDGTLTVLADAGLGNRSALADVKGCLGGRT